MPNLKDIRKRIQSVKNTSQITRSMKMVASAKLRKAQENILSARPYAYRTYAILISLFKAEEVSHPLLVERPEKRTRVVVLAGDRGLCGSFNTNIFKAAAKFIKDKESKGIEVTLDCIGKKTREFFKNKREIRAFHEGLLVSGTYSSTAEVAEEILNSYLHQEFDALYLIYNEFKSAIQQRVTCERLIPISTEVPDGVAGILKMVEREGLNNFLFEPSKDVILNEIIPRHFKVQLFRAVLESIASEHGARMTAMDNATRNGEDMIDRLTLVYNKARQASITKELMEIVSGVEAMK